MPAFATYLVLTAGLLLSVPACTPAARPFAAAPLRFSVVPDTARYLFRRSPPGSPYLTSLRTSYQLDQLVRGQPTDLARVQAVCAWVHRQWQHDGNNVPQRQDPASILAEAAQGQSFRCVEYGVVLSGALTALGIPARVLALKTSDVATRATGAGHVLTEAWLRDQQRWVLADGQWDVVPLLRGQPLNAVELQQALAAGTPGLTVASAAGTSVQKYSRWIRPYLYFFDTNFDSRFAERRTPGGLMLVPFGTPNPTLFQRTDTIRHMRYTHSVASFYAPPR